jgi:hypothetical protein
MEKPNFLPEKWCVKQTTGVGFSKVLDYLNKRTNTENFTGLCTGEYYGEDETGPFVRLAQPSNCTVLTTEQFHACTHDYGTLHESMVKVMEAGKNMRDTLMELVNFAKANNQKSADDIILPGVYKVTFMQSGGPNTEHTAVVNGQLYPHSFWQRLKAAYQTGAPMRVEIGLKQRIYVSHEDVKKVCDRLSKM